MQKRLFYKGKFLLFVKYGLLFLHLLLGTKRFGVNGRWFAQRTHQSCFSLSFFRRFFVCLAVYPLVKRYRAIKWRMGPSVGFVPRGFAVSKLLDEQVRDSLKK